MKLLRVNFISTSAGVLPSSLSLLRSIDEVLGLPFIHGRPISFFFYFTPFGTEEPFTLSPVLLGAPI